MSIEQGTAFAEGLRKLSDQFREDSRVRSEQYAEFLRSTGQEFQVESHDYAKDMVDRANQYIEDIQALYHDIYQEAPEEE